MSVSRMARRWAVLDEVCCLDRSCVEILGTLMETEDRALQRGSKGTEHGTVSTAQSGETHSAAHCPTP